MIFEIQHKIELGQTKILLLVVDQIWPQLIETVNLYAYEIITNYSDIKNILNNSENLLRNKKKICVIVNWYILHLLKKMDPDFLETWNNNQNNLTIINQGLIKGRYIIPLNERNKKTSSYPESSINRSLIGFTTKEAFDALKNWLSEKSMKLDFSLYCSVLIQFNYITGKYDLLWDKDIGIWNKNTEQFELPPDLGW